MDILVVKHYWERLNKDIPNFYYRLNAIENSKTTFGFLFSASETNATNRVFGKFLENFFDENQDNVDVIVKRAHNYLTKKVSQFPFIAFTSSLLTRALAKSIEKTAVSLWGGGGDFFILSSINLKPFPVIIHFYEGNICR